MDSLIKKSRKNSSPAETRIGCSTLLYQAERGAARGMHQIGRCPVQALSVKAISPRSRKVSSCQSISRVLSIPSFEMWFRADEQALPRSLQGN